MGKIKRMTSSEEEEDNENRKGEILGEEDESEEEEESEYEPGDGDDEDDDDEDDDEDLQEPLFLKKHNFTPPAEVDDCCICKKMPAALFTVCNHYYCCFNCYVNTHTPAAKNEKQLPSYCKKCEERVTAYYLVKGAAEREDGFESTQRQKRRCTIARAPYIEKPITSVMKEGFSSPDVVKCSVSGCKNAGRWMALHRDTMAVCYTEICTAHKDELEEKCPMCKQIVNGYYFHERVKK